MKKGLVSKEKNERLESSSRREIDDAKEGKGRNRAHLPNSEQLDEDVLRPPAEQHLTDEEDVGRQSALEHDGHVGGVEELDGEGSSLTPESVVLDGDLDPEPLEVDDGRKDGDGSDEVHDVGELVSVEGLLESSRLVVPGEEEMEEGDDGSFELCSSSGVDGGRGEGLPDDGFADVGSDEERDSGSETVSLLEEFVEEEDDEGGGDELENQEEADSSSEVRGLSVETGEDVDGSLSEGDDEGEDWRIEGEGEGEGGKEQEGRKEGGKGKVGDR